MLSRLILADEPGAWTTFTSDDREVRARLDPMWMGAENLRELINRPGLVFRVLDEQSAAAVMLADPLGRRVVPLLTDYLDAVGLGLEGLSYLSFVLDNLDLLEVDLLRLGLDVRDWLDPDGPLSSRRVYLLAKDFGDRPETNIGAKRFDLKPASKETIVLAQLSGGMSESGEPHMFLKSPSTLDAERRVQVETAAKLERIKQRGF